MNIDNIKSFVKKGLEKCFIQYNWTRNIIIVHKRLKVQWCPSKISTSLMIQLKH